jgi:phosphoglycerate kinase
MHKTLPSVTSKTDWHDVYVLVRSSINVPITNGVVTNAFRLSRGVSTINYLRQAGAKIIVCGHIGSDGVASVEPVAAALREYFPVTVSPEVVGDETNRLRALMQPGDVLLLENLRREPGEKKNEEAFVAKLVALADVYVNDAFPASHRTHASVVGVPTQLPSFVGHNFLHEYTELQKALEPSNPALFLLGGAKFDTKMPLVEKFLSLYDHIFIGGALANDFFKALGYEVGVSLVSDVSLVGSPLLTEPKILLPVDVVVDGPQGKRICAPTEVQSGERILDAGPATVAMLQPYIVAAATVLWNGPFGNFEAGYGDQTTATAKLIAQTKGYSVIGGGDTIAAIEALGNHDSYGFLSTAGGAMLTYLELGTLPAIEAIVHQKS